MLGKLNVVLPFTATNCSPTEILREGHFHADSGILSHIRPDTIDVAVSNPAYIKPPDEAYVIHASAMTLVMTHVGDD